MYSIPAHALRFAAHCRSRLRLTEISPVDCSRLRADADTVWIRLTRDHERPARKLTPRPPRSRS